MACEREMPMRVGMIGTGAISHKHAQAYKNIGFDLTVCTDINAGAGAAFRRAVRRASSCPPTRRSAAIPTWTTWTSARSRISACSRWRSARSTASTSRCRSRSRPTWRPRAQMIETARSAGILLGVVSQHRFDDSSQFSATRHRGRAAGQTAAVRLLCEVVPLGGILLAADQGKLGRRGRRRADQPGDPPDRHPALAGRARCRSCSATGSWARCTRSNPKTWSMRVLQYAIGRDGRDSGVHGVLAGIHGADRVPRHQGHGDHLRRQADHLGCGGRCRRAGAAGTRKWLPARPIRWRFRSSPSNGSSWISARRSRRNAKPLVAGEEGYAALEIVDAVYRSCRTGEKVAFA